MSLEPVAIKTTQSKELTKEKNEYRVVMSITESSRKYSSQSYIIKQSTTLFTDVDGKKQ